MSKKPKSAAVVTIRKAGAMTPKGRRAIVEWLRHQADMLEEHGKNYTLATFTARYLYK